MGIWEYCYLSYCYFIVLSDYAYCVAYADFYLALLSLLPKFTCTYLDVDGWCVFTQLHKWTLIFFFLPPLWTVELNVHLTFIQWRTRQQYKQPQLQHYMFITPPNNIQYFHRNVFFIWRKLNKTVDINTPTICEFINCDTHSLFEEWW